MASDVSGAVLISSSDTIEIAGSKSVSSRTADSENKKDSVVRETDIKSSLETANSQKAQRKNTKNRKSLVDKYLKYSPTTEAQNERWIALAEIGTKAKNIFLDVENSMIKHLNDTLADKNLVTSVTNFHKDLLNQKLNALAKEFPDMHIEKYSDFKSMRFAFGGKVPKDLETRFTKNLL